MEMAFALQMLCLEGAVSGTVLGVMLLSLENLGGLVSQVWGGNYILRAFNIVFLCDFRIRLRI